MNTKNLSDMRGSNFVSMYLILMYEDSDVTSGEFIHTERVHGRVKSDGDVKILTKEDVIHGFQSFLNWDESPETFDVYKLGNYWYTTQHLFDDYVEYKGVHYPVKTVNVLIDEHNDDWEHTYQIAPECLIDAMQEDGTDGYLSDDEDSEGYNVDISIYHYIEDQYWDLPLEVICKEHLDLPMTFLDDIGG